MILPPKLLRLRRRRGKIRPLYTSEDKHGLARTLISVFESHIDKKRAELRGALSRCEELGYNYKLVRGLAAVLEDRCIFETRASVDPVEARRAVFDEAGNRVVATEEERRKALAAAAFRLGVSVEDLDHSLYADLWDEQVLVDFDAPAPQELLREYNFATTLALLAEARRIDLTYKGRDEALEELGEALGRCQIHEVSVMSKLTIKRRPSKRMRRTSATLESLIYGLMLREQWRLAAEIRQPRTKRSYIFELNKNDDGKLVTPSGLKRRLTDRASARVKPMGSSLGEIVVVEDIASKLGITEIEVRQRMERSGRQYVDLGGVLITPQKLREVEEALDAAQDMRLSTMFGVLRRLGCRRPLPVLEALGYAVEWAGDRDQSKVYRLGGRRSTP